MADILSLLADQTASAPGTTVAIDINSLNNWQNAGATQLAKLDKDTKATISGQTPKGKKDKTKKVVVQETVPQEAQPTDPASKPESSNDRRMDVMPGIPDAYRDGNVDVEQWGTDEFPPARVVGEYENEQLASISIVYDQSGIETITSTAADAGVKLSAEDWQGKQEQLGRSSLITFYSRFFLNRVNEAQQEKYQIVETFTASYTFFYGKRPTIYNFSGFLMNDKNNKWTNDMVYFYENYFRGTRTAEFNAQAAMYYDGRLVTGFILGMQIQQMAELDKGATFSMDMLVIDHRPIHYSADIASLIAESEVKLKEYRDNLALELAKLNKNIPALQWSTAREAAVVGKSAKVNKKGKKQVAKKTSNKSDSVYQAAKKTYQVNTYGS